MFKKYKQKDNITLSKLKSPKMLDSNFIFKNISEVISLKM